MLEQWSNIHFSSDLRLISSIVEGTLWAGSLQETALIISRSAALDVQMLSVCLSVVVCGQVTKSQLSLLPDHLEGWFLYQNGVEFNFQ